MTDEEFDYRLFKILLIGIFAVILCGIFTLGYVEITKIYSKENIAQHEENRKEIQKLVTHECEQ